MMDSNEKRTSKELIIESAKKEFYENGYKDTTISKIFNSIDVPVGIFTYYFKTKDMLVFEIHKQFFEALDQLIVSKYKALESASFLKQAVLSKLYYKIILEDNNNARFYYQVLEKRSNYRVNREIISPIFRGVANEYEVVLSEEDFDLIMILNAGARREFFLNYFRTNMKIPVYHLSDMLEAMIPMMFRIDGKTVDSVLLKSARIADSLDCSQIKLLI
ncbi:MAG: TetR/AcrR family transcriptional regulator [Eubacteriaceae bacterium]|nr:TetR/AcrR family transcriptional regulator [Eubacteriaceae bacterium]